MDEIGTREKPNDANRDSSSESGMHNPGTQELLAGYMLVVNPIVCPECFLRYPKGTKVCKVCGAELPHM